MRFRENPENRNSILLQERITADNQKHWVELLKKIGEGDPSALGSLYQDTSSLVFGLILRIIADRAIAEELLVEVFKQVWKEAALFDAQRLAPLDWLLTMARSRALACLRSYKSEDEFNNSIAEDFPPQTELEKTYGFSSQQQLARAALATLSSTQRQIFELAYYGGLSPDEIVSRLKLPLVAVKKHLKLAMMRLREFLSPVIQEQL